jgi:hypothetical protein
MEDRSLIDYDDIHTFTLVLCSISGYSKFRYTFNSTFGRCLASRLAGVLAVFDLAHVIVQVRARVMGGSVRKGVHPSADQPHGL